MHRNFVAAVAAFGLFASAAVLAKEEPKQTDADKDKNETAEPAPEPASSTTHHEVQIDGQTVKYTATAGWLIMKDDKDKPIARFGYTAYTRDGSRTSVAARSCSLTTAARDRRPSGCTWGSSGPVAWW